MIIANLTKENDYQVFRLPLQYQIDDTKVYIKHVGNALFLIPYHNPWQTFMESINAFSDDYMEQRQQPEQQRDFFD